MQKEWNQNNNIIINVSFLINLIVNYDYCLIELHQIEMKLPEIAWVMQTLSFREDKAGLFSEQPSV